jgi:hypothetical protein
MAKQIFQALRFQTAPAMWIIRVLTMVNRWNFLIVSSPDFPHHFQWFGAITISSIG